MTSYKIKHCFNKSKEEKEEILINLEGTLVWGREKKQQGSTSGGL
jgi:hypothetical protein